jgi:hypothetical protein
MRIRLKAEYTQKKLLLQHILTLMKIVNTSILMIRPLDRALIWTFLKFLKQDLENQLPVLGQATALMLLLRNIKRLQKLVLVLEAIMLDSISARRQDRIKRSRAKLNRGVLP